MGLQTIKISRYVIQTKSFSACTKFIFKNNKIMDILVQQSLMSTINTARHCVFGPKQLLARRKLPEAPKRSPEYDPNYGYEPYWPLGDWVFERLDATTEKGTDTICGHECPHLYREFGTICGRNLNYTHKTFKNYCELLDEDCTGRSKWMIAYRGKCFGPLKTMPTKYDEMVTRAEDYISKFEATSIPTRRHRG